MNLFTRDDGRTLRVIDGFRKQALTQPRVSVQPKPEWSEHDYRAAAEKKVRNSERFVDELSSVGGTLEGACVLEVGCGAGIDCLLLGMHPVRKVIGTDMELALFATGDKAEQARRLAREVFATLGVPDDIDAVLTRRPIRFVTMSATQMSLSNQSVDLLWSRAVMEEVFPLERALAEMARVVRPGGILYHSIDPFYWLKGAYKSGIVDIPWAHARLTPAEYYRFVAGSEGERQAAKRSRRLKTLNQFTPRQWRTILEGAGFETLRWNEETAPAAEALLDEHPDVLETLLNGIEAADLTCRRIKVWMRKT